MNTQSDGHAVTTAQPGAALLALWDAAHTLHREDPCDCADGFGGCNHLSCYECGQEWPCEGVREALEIVTSEQYDALWSERFRFIEAKQAARSSSSSPSVTGDTP